MIMIRTILPRGSRRRLPGARAGVAALEFGLLAPVMGIFLMGLVDIADAIITLHRLNSIVQQTGLMATQMAILPNQQTTLTATQLDQASSVIYAVIPSLVNQPVYNPDAPGTQAAPPFAVVVSDIVFTPVTGSCTPNENTNCYTASMAWSVPLQYGMQLNRACGTVDQTTALASEAISTKTKLPTSIPTAGVSQGLSSVLVVDVIYQFTPIFAKFVGPLTMRQTAYFNQRSYVAPYIHYIAGSSPGGIICTGYV
jgi:Flp pilus assembly protein TadG